jgi:tetratricopeptide (TPR) repeat protein
VIKLLLRVQILSALLLISPAFAQAEKPEPCFGTRLGQQAIKECTAIIDDPATDPARRSDAFGQRGLALSMMKRYAEAIADYDKAIEINPDADVSLNNRAWAWFRWQGSTKGMADVERALKLAPGADSTWDTRAHLRQLEGDHEGAFNDYEAAVGIGGERAVRAYQCGLSQRGHYKGRIDGIYSAETRAALKTCAFIKTCDPLPDDLDSTFDDISCDQTTS